MTGPRLGKVGLTLIYMGQKLSGDLCIAQFISRGQAGIWDSSAENALSQGGCCTSVSRPEGGWGWVKMVGVHTSGSPDLLPPLVLSERRQYGRAHVLALHVKRVADNRGPSSEPFSSGSP